MDSPALAFRDLSLFWAKLARGPLTLGQYHPLLCHMVDVAQVVRLLWQNVVPPAARREATCTVGIAEEEAERWIAFWAGLHDMGKASPAFQLKDASARDRLQKVGLHCPNPPPKGQHGAITAAVLPGLLKDATGLPGDLASRVATVVGGHHGVFPRSAEVNDALSASGKGAWAVARTQLAQVLAGILGVPASVPRGTLDNATAMALAGLVSVADWIGSNEDYFPYAVSDGAATPDIALNEYADQAERCARKAIAELAWTGSVPSRGRSFSELFPGCAPRPVQQEAVSLAQRLDGPSLVVIEAPMGEGKTEAAIYLADNAALALGERGCYFALPTQATSNQMFGRVRDFLARRYTDGAVQLQLLHGHAALSAEFEVLKRNADHTFDPQAIYDEKPASSPPNVVAAEWFTHRKRGLLAPFGVGTVDQALLAVLQTKHVFVRLFGLSHKTVILDEVHAYDTYMSALLERLLEWLGALGSSVVLLSATLPSARRDKLVNAYARGLDRSPPALPVAAYPRISWVSNTAQGATHVETSVQSTKEVRLEWIEGQLPQSNSEPFGLGERLQAALASGGCAAVICNTVGRAQQVYLALKPYFPGQADDGQPELDLLHARYLYEDRETRQKRSEVRFGRPGGTVTQSDGTTAGVRRPHRAVLVATQVIEQSLDLDFDLMVTDLAPADLVLQRAGRLHRHQRERPFGLDKPVLWLCRPEETDGAPKFDGGTGAVYDKHILLRSWLDLEKRSVVRIPEEVEDIIEAVYNDNRPCPGSQPEAVKRAWEDTKGELKTVKAEHEAKAKLFRILPPHYEDDIFEDFNRELEEDDPSVHRSVQALTRLGDPSLGVVLLDPQELARIDLGVKPGIATVKELLNHSVTISHAGVVHGLLQLETPPGWRQSPLLRHHRLVELDAGGCKTIGKYGLRLDSDLGVVIERLRQEVEDA